MIIEVKELVKYFGDYKALDGISFSVGSEERVGIIGPNGAGKTTLIRILLDVFHPTSGWVKIFGQNVSENYVVRKRVGFVMEYPGFYPKIPVNKALEFLDRIYGNPCESRTSRINEILDQLELKEEANKWVMELSKGMKQRLAVGRVLLQEPELLIMDEPMASLDVEGQVLIRHLIKSRFPQSTVLYTSHNLHEVQGICDRIIVLKNGQNIRDAPLLDLVKSFSEMRYIYDLGERPSEKVTSKLQRIEGITSIKLTEDSLEVITDGEDEDLPVVILDRLRDNGVKVKGFRKVEKDLEEIYLSLLGGG